MGECTAPSKVSDDRISNLLKQRRLEERQVDTDAGSGGRRAQSVQIFRRPGVNAIPVVSVLTMAPNTIPRTPSSFIGAVLHSRLNMIYLTAYRLSCEQRELICPKPAPPLPPPAGVQQRGQIGGKTTRIP